MLDSRYQRYFAVIRRYHQFSADERPSALEGFLKVVAMSDPDLKTRDLVSAFYQQEAARLGSQHATS